MATHSPVLWQSSDGRISLIDIPRSIEAAQRSTTLPFPLHLLSSSPLSTPFATNEPKSAAARAKVEQSQSHSEVDQEYTKVLKGALHAATGAYTGTWCLLRPFVADTPRVAKKRKLNDFTDDVSPSPKSDIPGLPEDVLPMLAYHAVRNQLYDIRLARYLDEEPKENVDEPWKCDEERDFFANDTDDTASLQVQPTADEKLCNFHIPQRASFYIGDCKDSEAFHRALSSYAKKTGTRKTFDFILLDPPWPNRSVKRTHKTPKSTYATVPSLYDIREMILNMQLDLLMAEECLLGIWITNKPAVRELVLGDGGLFECLGVELIEEWLWLKVTTSAEPVSPIDALWRKPYEVLLLGRKRRKPSHGSEVQQGQNLVQETLKRRVIIGIPDLHSRKPCLKSFIEPLLSNPEDYRALEAFARHLVAGWCSWGDECIKFNWDGYWSRSDVGSANESAKR